VSGLAAYRRRVRAFLRRHRIQDPDDWLLVIRELRRYVLDTYLVGMSLDQVCRIRRLPRGPMARALYEIEAEDGRRSPRPSYLLKLCQLMGWKDADFRAWLRSSGVAPMCDDDSVRYDG